jgi:DNA-binding transcriptional MerR regulator
MNEKGETYSISQVSQMTGVTKNRIREWQVKGFLPGIQSISVGRFHRRFTEKEIAMIPEINE